MQKVTGRWHDNRHALITELAEIGERVSGLILSEEQEQLSRRHVGAVDAVPSHF